MITIIFFGLSCIINIVIVIVNITFPYLFLLICTSYYFSCRFLLSIRPYRLFLPIITSYPLLLLLIASSCLLVRFATSSYVFFFIILLVVTTDACILLDHTTTSGYYWFLWLIFLAVTCHLYHQAYRVLAAPPWFYDRPLRLGVSGGCEPGFQQLPCSRTGGTATWFNNRWRRCFLREYPAPLREHVL